MWKSTNRTALFSWLGWLSTTLGITLLFLTSVQLVLAQGSTFTQSDYRWYANRNNKNPNTPLAGQNTPTTGVSPGTVVRLRMNVLVGTENLTKESQAFKLQYATSTSGPWTDVGAIGSGEVWRGYDNGRPADGAKRLSLLLTNSDVSGTYEEENPSALNPVAINVGERGEWDWVLEANNTSTSTDYYFRMVESDGTVLDGYTRYPQLTTAPPPTFTQNRYRWFENRDNKNPSTPLASENRAYNATTITGQYRLRVNVRVTGVDVAVETEMFKLQYATSTSGPWTDVGATGSAEAWRGYDNPTPADGETIGGKNKELSNSDVAESYEEENPSAANPRAINVGERGEWDWVLDAHDPTPDTSYYFRMVKADGTPLDGYSRYPRINVPPVVTLEQKAYRWYENRNRKNPDTPLAGQNNSYDAISLTGIYRIRMNVTVDGSSLPEDTQAFKLQYATSTSGPWTDVGAIGSGEAWRGYDNSSPTDGVDGLTLLLTSSDVSGTYEEENPSALNPNAVAAGQQVEYDWVVEANNTANNTTYHFRMVKASGDTLDTYIRYPTINMPAPLSLTQDSYRWFENKDSRNPDTPLASENTAYSTPYHDMVYRIRMNLLVSNQPLQADDKQFKLQYATSTSGPWTDVGATGSGEAWRGYDNPTPVDGENIGGANLELSNSDVAESYEEENPSAANPRAINVGERGEWDWVVEDNGASPETTYYFRMVESDGTALATYTRYPTIIIPPELTLTQDVYRWYANRDNKNPNTPLADENTLKDIAARGGVYRLRTNVLIDGASIAVETQAFKLQYATSTSGPWTDVGAIGSGETWRGYDNGRPADGAKNLTLLLTNSDVSGTYEEENPSALNPNLVAAGQRAEWDWVLEDNGVSANTTYYFRMVESDGTALSGYTRYPTITTFGINVAPVVDSVSLVEMSMTPQTQYTVNVTVSDADSIDDIQQVVLKLWYDSDGGTPGQSEFDAASADVQNCAVVTWTKSGQSSVAPILTPSGTTWSLDSYVVPASPPDFNGTTFAWSFTLTVGKVATETTGAARWQIGAKATDGAGADHFNYDGQAVTMNFYGEILSLGGASIDWGTVSTGTGFGGPNSRQPLGATVTYIANGAYDEKVKASATWTGSSATAFLDELGACNNSNEFALKADDTANLASAVLVNATGVTIDDTGTQTTESGDQVTTNTLWLKVASVFTKDTYSGTITYIITNGT